MRWRAWVYLRLYVWLLPCEWVVAFHSAGPSNTRLAVCSIVLRELGLRPTPLFYSKYPPSHLDRVRPAHKAIHERRRRIANPKKRGHKGH